MTKSEEFTKVIDDLKLAYTDKNGVINHTLYFAALEVAMWHVTLYVPDAIKSFENFVDYVKNCKNV
jgi:hypothetical protein